MRTCRVFLLFLAATILFSTIPSGAQAGPLKRLFSGAKKVSREKIPRKKRSGFKGSKWVEINLTDQKLRAYEGNRLVLATPISSGRNRSTPTGNFIAGPYKAENHYSSLYHGAHMPWSVQINGDIFIHGFSSVPEYPASHGCVRVPLTGNNPAKHFYDWVEVGTPVRIVY